MTRSEHIRQLLTEVGPALDLAGVSEFDERTWAVVRDGDTSVLLELHEGLDLLTATVELGRPSEENRLTTYETALVANFAADSPVAPRLSLLARGGTLQLSQNIAAASLSLDSLSQALVEMHKQIDQWRRILSSGGIPAAAEASDVNEMPAGMRV